MSTYKRKDGTVVVTRPIKNAVLNKKGLLKLVEVIPPNPDLAYAEVRKAFIRIFRPEIVQTLRAKMKTRSTE